MIGIGIDICEIARIEKLFVKNKTFFTKYYSQEEWEYIQSRGVTAGSSAAAMFAAKEAFLKAIGSGIAKLSLKDISVLHAPNGRPSYNLSEKAAEYLTEIGGKRVHLSISHEAGVAVAVAIIE